MATTWIRLLDLVIWLCFVQHAHSQASIFQRDGKITLIREFNQIS
jgi:hypothetical protein